MKLKKILTVTCMALLFVLLAACGTREIPWHSVSIVQWFSDYPYERVFHVSNSSSRNLALVGAPLIEQEIGYEWHTFKEIDYLQSFYIDANGENFYRANWELPPGRYRLLMTFQCRRNADLQVEADVWLEISKQLDLDITMEILPESVSPWGAAFLITNNSGFDVESVSGLTVYTMYAGEWHTSWEAAHPIFPINIANGNESVIAHTWVPGTMGNTPMRITKLFRYVGAVYTIWDEIDVEFIIQPQEVVDIGANEYVGVIMESMGYSHFRWQLDLVITNNTDSYAIFNHSAPFIIEQNINGRWVFHNHLNVGNPFKLPPGGSRELGLRWHRGLRNGEFRVGNGVAVGLESPETAITAGLSAEFVVEDDTITEEMHGIYLNIHTIISPMGVLLELTNAFNEGTIYFDGDYILQKYDNGIWVNELELSPQYVPYGQQFLGARQRRFITKYWGWFHDRLPNGEYRIAKTFWHHGPGGEVTEHELYVDFGVITNARNPHIRGHLFRGEVLEVEHRPAPLAREGLLVRGLGFDEFEPIPQHRGRYANMESYINETAHVAVFDASGRPIRFSDIPVGAIVDIILNQQDRYPFGAKLIRIVE